MRTGLYRGKRGPQQSPATKYFAKSELNQSFLRQNVSLNVARAYQNEFVRMNSENYIGRYWRKVGDRIHCDLCPRRCQLPDGKRGFCFVRQNIGGELILTTYGKSTGFCIDPIEKKPLNHFLPGSPVLSFGTAGCNLGCKFCQNWDISKSKEIEILSEHATPEAIVAAAKEYGCRSIAFTYNDPVIWAEYAIETAKIARAEGIKTVAVTAGYITPEAREDFFQHIDAANVDLKAFSEEFYHSITFSHLQPVLETLKWLKDESNVWFEITNLMIPGTNDSRDEIEQLCEWIVKNLGQNVPLHFSAFHPDYKMRDKPSTPGGVLLRAREQAIRAGLNYVYVGNVHDSQAQSTYCPGCSAALIERDWYELGAFRIKESKCSNCHHPIPGLFEDSPGDWGNKRLPINISNPSRSGQPLHTAKSPAPRTEFNDSERTALIEFTRKLVLAAVGGPADQLTLPKELAESPCYGVFVTLKRGSLLRACRGSWGNPGANTLGQVLMAAAVDTATKDPRFLSISAAEVPLLSVDVSIMHDPQPLERNSAEHVLRPGIHGIVLSTPQRRGLLLPQVATENNWNALQFLEAVSRKAGLEQDAWKASDTTLMTFRSVLISSPSAANEVDEEQLSDEQMAALIKVANHILSQNSAPIQISRALADKSAASIGISLESANGLTSASFSAGSSLLDLVQQATSALNKVREKFENNEDRISRLTIFTHAVPLQPVDFPERCSTLGHSAVYASSNGARQLIPPQPNASGAVQAAKALASVGATPYSWKNGNAQLVSFSSRTFASANNDKARNRIRPPAVAGSFYPQDPDSVEGEITKYLKDTPKDSVKAVLLPHAGWRYCGATIGKVLSGLIVPERVIVIGPKHTPFGARIALAPEKFWRIPGKNCEIDETLLAKMSEDLPGSSLDHLAHAREHSIEVILPFLTKLNQNVKIAPLVVGELSLDEALELAQSLARILRGMSPSPLMVISSDMNHYATESENRRLDSLALECIDKMDPIALYEECERHSISMCGRLPAIIVMQALKILNGTCRATLCDYRTSADAGGDISRVVGYAGYRFE